MIKRMISRDLQEFREFQTRTVEVGRIRTGQYVVPEGKKGRPVKLDRFRLTSDKEEHIVAAAEQYGGEARPYQPQGGGAQQWEVVTELGSLEVLIINGQLIDPVYEMWGAGRTCIRRCDGEWNAQTREPCLCNDPKRRPKDDRQLCKVTTRVQVMLPSVAGLHAWRLETHSENAAVEMAAPTVGGLVRIAQVPVPATLYLRREQRRERDHEEEKFVSKDFYVPTFHIRLSALELAAGPEAITAALVANGAPTALAPAETRRELEARPVSAVPASTPPAARRDPVDGVAVLAEGELPRILLAVEKADTLEALEKLKNEFAARNVRHPAVFAAWKSKRAAVEAEQERQEAETAQAEQAQEAYADQEPYDDSEPYIEGLDRSEPQHMGEGMPCLNPWCAQGPNPCGFTPNEHLGAHGPQALLDEDRRTGRAPAEEGVVEGDGLPMVPVGTYEVAVELPRLMAVAGKFSPPLTTDQVRARVLAAFDLKHIGHATGEQFARVRAALEAELAR